MAAVGCRQMYTQTPNFGDHQLWFIASVCQTLFHECASIRLRVRTLPHNNQAESHIIHRMHNWGRRSLSIECTPKTLVSISSTSSLVSAKLCSMSVHQSIQELEFYRIISRLNPISYAREILERAIVDCLSNTHPHIWCLSAPLQHLCLQTFLPWVCIDPYKSYNFTA